MYIILLGNNLNIQLETDIFYLEHILLALLAFSLYTIINTKNLLKVVLLVELSALFSEILMVLIGFQNFDADNYIYVLFYMCLVAAEGAVLLTLVLFLNSISSQIKLNKF